MVCDGEGRYSGQSGWHKETPRDADRNRNVGNGKLVDGTNQGGPSPKRPASWQITRVNIYLALTLCCVKHLTHIMSLILASPTPTAKEVGAVVSLAYRSGKQSTAKLNDLPKVTRR